MRVLTWRRFSCSKITPQMSYFKPLTADIGICRHWLFERLNPLVSLIFILKSQFLIKVMLQVLVKFFDILTVFEHFSSTSESKTTKFGPVSTVCLLENWFKILPLGTSPSIQSGPLNLHLVDYCKWPWTRNPSRRNKPYYRQLH